MNFILAKLDTIKAEETQISSKFKEYYEQKVALRNLFGKENEKESKIVLTDSQMNTLYPFPIMTKLKIVLELIYTDK